MLAATRDLLTDLEPLPHQERMRRLAGWARTSPDRAAVSAELRAGDSYRRRLALTAAMVAGDTGAIDAATRDPYPAIRVIALNAALRAGILGGRMAGLAPAERRRIYRTLRRVRSPQTADALIREVREQHGDDEAAAVLPACGPETVRALLPDLEHAVNVAALAAQHPEILLARVAERLAAAAPDDRHGIWWETGDAVLSCAPGDVLDLVERFGPEDSLPGSPAAYGRIARHDPGRVAALLTAPGRVTWMRRTLLPPSLLRRLAVLPTDRLAPLARRLRDFDTNLTELLLALPPARRGEVYDAALSDMDTAAHLPSSTVMEALPAAVRIREATRVRALPKVREREASVLTWSAYLAWPEASAAIGPALASGDAEERATGYRLLVDAARRSRSPEAVAQVLDRLARLRNEQDPVRSAAVSAFGNLVRLLTPAAADRLTRLTTDVVDARDSSAGTTRALGRLAAGVLQHHVGVPELRDWALLTIDLVSSGSAVPVLWPFDAVLRRGQETLVFERLRGWAEEGMARGRYTPLFALTRAFGRRAWNIAGLQELLGRAIEPHTLPGVAREAIGLWLEPRRGRDERVAAVLAMDPSAIALDQVWRIVGRRRTDLLDVVLGPARPERIGSGEPARPEQIGPGGGLGTVRPGRFVQAGVRWVPDRAVGAERWLPRQQERFVALQAEILRDSGTTVWARARALHAAAVVPEFGRELVLRYVGSDEVPIAEAALGSLIWTDRPDEALPVLLAHAGGDRARVAMYAAGRAAAYVPPGQLADLLGPVVTAPTAKITSRKEVARLLARFGPPAAMATLLAAYTDPDAHRDVRAAIVSAARQNLHAEGAWAILEAAGAGSREERRAVLSAMPQQVAERHRPRYARLIVAACTPPPTAAPATFAGGSSPGSAALAGGDLSTGPAALAGGGSLPASRRPEGDREVRRAALQALPHWARWAGDVTGLVVERFTDLSERLAPFDASGLVQTLRGVGLRPAFERLVAADQADPRPGRPGADRPARRRIETLVRAIIYWSRHASVWTDRSGTIETMRWLADQPGHLRPALKALISLGRLDNLDEIADRCANRPAHLVRAAEEVAIRARELPEDFPALPALAAALTSRGDLAGGLFALALVSPGSEYGWAGPWRDALLALREHPLPDVRDEAFALQMT